VASVARGHVLSKRSTPTHGVGGITLVSPTTGIYEFAVNPAPTDDNTPGDPYHWEEMLVSRRARSMVLGPAALQPRLIPPP
jgi:hypothetical protein